MHYSLFHSTLVISKSGGISNSSLSCRHKFNRSVSRIYSLNVELLLLVICALVHNITNLLRVTIGCYVLDYLLLKASLVGT